MGSEAGIHSKELPDKLIEQQEIFPVSTPVTRKRAASQDSPAPQRSPHPYTTGTQPRTPTVVPRRKRMRANPDTPEICRQARQELSDTEDEHDETTDKEEYSKDVKYTLTKGAPPPQYDGGHSSLKKYLHEMANTLDNPDRPKQKYDALGKDILGYAVRQCESRRHEALCGLWRTGQSSYSEREQEVLYSDDLPDNAPESDA